MPCVRPLGFRRPGVRAFRLLHMPHKVVTRICLRPGNIGADLYVQGKSRGLPVSQAIAVPISYLIEIIIILGFFGGFWQSAGETKSLLNRLFSEISISCLDSRFRTTVCGGDEKVFLKIFP